MVGCLGIDVIEHRRWVKEWAFCHRAVLLGFLPGGQDLGFELFLERFVFVF